MAEQTQPSIVIHGESCAECERVLQARGPVREGRREQRREKWGRRGRNTEEEEMEAAEQP